MGDELEKSEARIIALEADLLSSAEQQQVLLQKCNATERASKQLSVGLHQKIQQQQNLRWRAEEHAAALEHRLKESEATAKRQRLHAQELHQRGTQQSVQQLSRQAAQGVVQFNLKTSSRIRAGMAPTPVSQRLETAYQRAKHRQGSRHSNSNSDSVGTKVAADPYIQLLRNCCSRQLEIVAE